MTLLADYYDGRSSRRHVVSFSLERDGDAVFVRVQGVGIERRAALLELRVSEPMGRAPRLVSFSDGAHCEIRDHESFRGLLNETGHGERRVVRWQFDWRRIVVATGGCVVLLLAGYRWGLPALADRIAAELPDSALESLSERALKSLDERFWAPSQLSAERQTGLSARLAALNVPGAAPVARRLEFRAGRATGANAFALPSGTLVLTDELVALARSDEELMGVLAHELGHVQARHGMRQVVRSAIIGVLAAWFVGDISSALAGVPAALIEAGYSRDFEREADAFAARLLNANEISPRCLADILLRIDRAGEAASGAGKASAYLSSHPASEERIGMLAGPRCR